MSTLELTFTCPGITEEESLITMAASNLPFVANTLGTVLYIFPTGYKSTVDYFFAQVVNKNNI